ncbi:ATP-binding cassette sub-family G member 1-like [Copidosoma floridanum]|uniref:ATP-binding cassette sub-family G member 1-like n=1 Tax=Copidosoma floridanum TaxID=29053 RepID=UPI0006C9C66A|nr:ATP-binding cassette sub-family G member 1-like [Copidosoma floridanum]
MMDVSKAELALEVDAKVINNRDDGKLVTLNNAKRLDLSFSEISYSVRSSLFSSERKKLLSNVSGNFRAGELTAIMGPSGAGKTMLMDILAGFVTTSVSGDIMINGSLRNRSAFRRSQAYIMQNHVMHDLLTVQESMHVAAELKLRASSSDKRKRINVLLRDLGLHEVRSTYAGSLSTGQKKRLAIAMELVSDVPIMFFDEPTSGLDSVTTRQCVELLKSLAYSGRTIICTIHQPSASLFALLDNLYVIAKGHCVYTGSPDNVRPYLNALGLCCPNYHNPADFLLEAASGEYGDHTARMSQAIKNGSSSRYRNPGTDARLVLDSPKSALLEMSGGKESGRRYASGTLAQIRVLLWRYMRVTYRDRMYIMEILVAHLVMAIVTGLTFQKVGQDAARSLENVKQMNFNLIFISFCAINAALITFPEELPKITREHFNKWYKLHSIYIATKIMGFILVSIAVSGYTVITWHMSDQLPEYHRLGYLVFNSVAIALVNQAMGLLISVLLNVRNVVFIGPYSIMPPVLFSGMFMRRADVLPILDWTYDVSIFKYAYDTFMISIFGFDRPRMKCLSDYCHLSSPKATLSMLNVSPTSYWSSPLVLVSTYVVLHVITYFCLRYKLKIYKFR